MNRARIVLLSSLIALSAPALAQPKPARPDAPAAAQGPTLEQFMRIRTPGAPAMGPDGALFVRDWPDGVYQIYRVEGPAARPDAKTVRLTGFKDGASGYTLSPDGSRLIAVAGVGGNENTNFFSVDPRASGPDSVKPLIENPKVQYQFGFWLRDSSGFVYTGNQDSPSDFQIFRYDFAGPNAGKSTRLLAKEGSWEAADITPDGKRLLVAQFRSASDSSIFELNTESGELTDLTVKPEGGTASNSWLGYAPDFNAAYLTSDHIAGKRQLFSIALPRSTSAGKPQASPLIPDLAKFELDEAGMNPEKTLLGVVINQDGYGVLHLYHLPGLEPAALPRIPQGVVNLGQMRGQRVLYSLSNARTPGLAFAFEASKKGEELKDPAPRQITFADTQSIDLSKFPLPELVEYTSFDGLKVPAFVYLPPGAQKGKPIPFVIRFHGGPEGQSRPAFEREAQYLLTRGYGLMLPNVRGSTGYGRDYLTMDDYTKRWDSVKDGVEAARWLVKEGYSQAGRIAVWGGSYGGFMAAATPVEDGRSDRPVLGASVDIVGIVNFRTFLEQTAGYRRKLREVEYGPLTDGAFLDSISPLKHIENIKIPMLIGHGLNDPRVPVGEALQLNLALRKRGIPTDLLVFPDEGHGFAKLENRLLFSKTMVDFLDRTIGK